MTLTDAALWLTLFEQALVENPDMTLRQLDEMVATERIRIASVQAEDTKADCLTMEQKARAFVAEVKLGRVRWPK